jgi:hypothetical protein
MQHLRESGVDDFRIRKPGCLLLYADLRKVLFIVRDWSGGNTKEKHSECVYSSADGKSADADQKPPVAA